MKPAPFQYIAAESLEEAVAALGEHGDEAKILAGGQSLVPLMNLRLAVPAVLVDVNPVAELRGIAVNGAVEIGAVARQAAVERSPEIRAHAPLLADALRHVAYPGVRSRGTVGGSAAHADPAAEVPAVLVALEAELVARGPGGSRAIPADDFFVSYFTTALEPTEVLTHVRVPKGAPDARFGFQEVARKQGDFALAGAAVAATLDGKGACRSARIVLFGVADAPVRVTAAEEALAGRPLAEGAAAAGQAAPEAFEPKSDSHASAEFRREVVAVLVRRALEQAARGGEGS